MCEPVRRAAEAEAGTIRESWGSLSWYADAMRIGNAQGLTLGRVVIHRGCANPRHHHAGCEEVLHLLRGRLRHTLGDAVHELGPGDTLVVPAGVVHNAESVGGEDAEMIVAFSSGTRDFVPEKA